MRAGWSTPAAGQSSQTDTAAGESFRPVELRLAGGAGSRIGAAVAGAIMVGGGASVLATTAPWRPREMVTVGSAMAGPLLVLIIWAGAMFLAMAVARPGRLRVDHDRLSIVSPALLSRTLVVPRAMVATVTVDPVANREPRKPRGGGWSAARSQSSLLREAQEEQSAGTPWWPVDLAAYLPLLAAGPAGSAGAPNAAIVLTGPLRVPTRASMWALSRPLAKVMERPPRPGMAVRGFVLRLADPGAALSALAEAVELGPLETRQVAPLAPQRAGVRPRTLAWGVAAAVVIGAVLGHGYWQSLGQSRLADQGCRGLQAVLRERPGPASAPSRTTGALASSLPAGTFPVLGFERPATGEGELDLDAAASLQPDSAATGEALQANGYIRGHGREWRRPDGGRVQALVYEFGSREAAAAFDIHSAQLSCAYADDAFTVAGSPDALGLRVRTDHGVRDQVSFLQGARRYEIRLEHVAEDGYAAISALTEAAVRAAG